MRKIGRCWHIAFNETIIINGCGIKSFVNVETEAQYKPNTVASWFDCKSFDIKFTT